MSRASALRDIQGGSKKRVNRYNLLYLNQNLSDQRKISTISTLSQIVYCIKISNLLNVRLLRYDRLSVTPSKRVKNERSVNDILSTFVKRPYRSQLSSFSRQFFDEHSVVIQKH